MTAQRDKGSPAVSAFWWIVRGTENLSVTIGGVRLPETARLKLYRLENHTAKPLEEFNLCDVQGAGALYQVTIAGKGLRETGDWKSLSFLEACMRAYLDGAAEPILLSSGLEDYFLGTYYFNKGRYANNRNAQALSLPELQESRTFCLGLVIIIPRGFGSLVLPGSQRLADMYSHGKAG